MRPDCLKDEDKEAADDDSLGESLQVAAYAPWLHFRNIYILNRRMKSREEIFSFSGLNLLCNY
jgi:hypothetical protein